MLPILTVLALLLSPPILANQRIRTVELKKDEIVTVRTALAVATIVQVPDRPLSIVVGDSDAFKVEYLDQAITIKPLHPGAKSNLYIYTDYRRYDVSLVTTAEVIADYVVYLKAKQAPSRRPEAVRWRLFERHVSSEGLTIFVKRLGSSNNVGLLEFQLISKDQIKIDPGIFWLTQNGSTKEIEKLVLSDLETGSKKNVFGLIQVDLKKISQASALRFELRRKKTVSISLPDAGKWK